LVVSDLLDHIHDASPQVLRQVHERSYSGVGTAQTNHCKVNVISSPSGIVTKLTTEDSNRAGGSGPIGSFVNIGSICAKHLGMRRQV
jgi:hypothetical protein